MAALLRMRMTRRFSAGLRSRQTSGLFGRGWFTPWQSHLVIERGGEIVRLVSEAGSARVFSRDTRDNSYFSGAGDSARLVASGGGYELHDPNGMVTRFRTDGKIEHVQDPNGNRVTAAYSSPGQLTTLTHSSGASISIAYNGNGLISEVSNSAGRRLSYTYSGSYLTGTTTDDGKTTTYGYQTAGAASRLHALISINRGGVTRHFTWDDRGRLASSFVADGQEMAVFGYDSAGGVTVTAGGGITSLSFEHRGLLSKVVDPLGNITTSEFNADLRLSRLMLPTGDSQSFTWCNCGSPASITDELGHTTRFRYDHPLKKMTSFTDAKGNLTRYSYDAKGNLLDTTYADHSVERFGNHATSGLPQSHTNRRGQSMNITYTAAGLIDRRSFADGSYDDFDYDTRGNLMKVTEHPSTGPDKVTDYTYDPAVDGDLLRKVTYSEGRWVEYFYDAYGRRERITDSAGGHTRYAYNTVGRLWKVSDASGTLLAEYLYDGAGRLLRINKGNGTWTVYEYDAADRILSLTNHATGGLPNSRFVYAYDARGRRTSMETMDGKWTYAYDATGQLTQAVFNSSSPGISSQNLRYSYDALGNRASTVLNGITTTYTANSLNQYTQVAGVSYQYDADGNLLSDGEKTYSYDTESRLIQVTGPEGVTQYEYDALGGRVATISNGDRSDYLLDPTGIVNVVGELKDSGVVSRRIHGLGLVAELRGSSLSYFDSDAAGNIVGSSDVSGLLKGGSSYSPFGEVLSTSFESSAGYVGQFGVENVPGGMVYMRARFYSIDLGRFTQTDPIQLNGGDANLYRYVDNSVVNAVDPEGLISWGPIITVGTAIKNGIQGYNKSGGCGAVGAIVGGIGGKAAGTALLGVAFGQVGAQVGTYIGAGIG
ncbi:MAG: RHS repeat protein, partial [Oxalobacteraceae bacterium]